ncbi:MAG: NUDIX hydrolase [Synergistaceae bacterium]|nr:NUDIX hydrolase [Synergistaceae bacterium]
MTKNFERYIELMKERPEEFDNSDAEYIIITDPDRIAKFESETGKTIGVVYESPWHIMLVDLVTPDNKKFFTYERILPAVKKGAAAALTMCGEDFIMLKQYRHALRGFQYCFPRGFAEKGLSPEENLRKELSEELSTRPEDIENIKFLGTVIADSGLSGVNVNVYLCKINAYKTNEHHEGIRKVEVFSRSELYKLIRECKITDGFTLSALQLLNSLE